ncbi:sulfotransferase [Novosphingobium sp. PASSN1]|uniref:sulfotransferase family protein n=1 Tax=Novosphingobium sp. PASSN1 TaxID=2015561 RepID=UPI000BC6715F|nr:sulfotransferase [Novosphingobium sp. PASSN1]OYU34223.1 MAG: hypothetical protein CFE35_16570 [Novosphingobium sp. PASSN1]
MERPIFITGAARCGTELARSLLNRHPLIHIAAESHYFDDPRPRLADAAAPTAAEATELLAYFRRIGRHGYGLPLDDVDAGADAALRAAWQAEGPGADALFAAFCRRQAMAAGKPIWGEKTPRHLFRAADIFAAFPGARLIICLRDPRGAVASYRDWRNNWFDRGSIDAQLRAGVEREEARVRRSYNLTVTTLLWRAAAQAALATRQQFGVERVLVVRFESLLAAPESEVRRLTDWLGVAYDPALLDISRVNSSYAGGAAQTGLDTSVGDRWRQRLTPGEAAYIAWLTGDAMASLGYAGTPARPPLGQLTRELAALPLALARILAANRSRIGNLPAFLSARLQALRT